MVKPLRVLLVEDTQDDAELLEMDLRRGGYEPSVVRVETAQDFSRQLERADWDLIISDYSMPHFDGIEALEIFNAAGQEIPFILMSGLMGENVAVDAMVRGAHDYVMKDNRSRLLPAIQRELRAAELRREKREHEAKYRTLFETMAQGVLYHDAQGKLVSANPAARHILGALLDHAGDITAECPKSYFIREDGTPFHPQDYPAVIALRSGRPVLNVVMGFFRLGMEQPHWILVNAIPQFLAGASDPYEVYSTLTDITEQRRLEEHLSRINDCLLRQGGNYKERINRFTALCGELLGGDCALYSRLEDEYLYTQGQWNTPPNYPAKRRAEGYACYDVIQNASNEVMVVFNLSSSRYVQVNPEISRQGFQTYLGASVKTDTGCVGALCVLFKRPFVPTDYDKRIMGILASAMATEERRRSAEKDIQESEERYKMILETALDSFCILDTQGRFLDVNQAYCDLTGYTHEELLSMSITDVDITETPAGVDQNIQQIMREGSLHLERRHRCKSGQFIHVDISAKYLSGESKIFAFLRDISERKRMEDEARNNEEHLRRRLEIITSPEVEIDTQDLKAILDVKAIQELMDDFYRVTRMGMAILDLEGNILVATGWQDICTQFHRRHPLTAQNCFESDQQLSLSVNSGEYLEYRCKNHMWDIVTPISVEGKHFANLFMGQFFYEGESPDIALFEAQAKTCGFDLTEYLAALDRVPHWNRAQVQHVMAFYAKFADLVARLSHNSIKMAKALTAQEQSRHALLESENLYHSLVENLPQNVFRKDCAGRFTFVNRLFCQTLGKTPTDILGKTDMDIYPPYLAAQYQAADKHVMETGKTFEMVEKQHIHDHPVQYVQVIKTPLFDAQGAISGVQGIFWDITARKEAEESLLKSEAALAEAQRIAHVGSWEYDMDSNHIAWSKEMFQIFGREESLGEPSWADHRALIHPDDWAMANMALQSAIRENKSYQIEFRILRPNGDTAWLWAIGHAILSPENRVTKLLGTVQDITERKRAEESAIRLATALEQTAEAVVITDLDSQIQYVNPAFSTITGYSQADILGKNPRILQSGRHDPAFYAALWDALNRGEVWAGHFINKRKDGSLYEEECTISPVRDAGGIVVNYVAIKRDVTHELELEQQLRHAQKMEAIGTLAGGIAHDFNNILQAILGYAELARSEMPRNETAESCMKEIVTAGERARDLVAQILAFSRRAEQERAPIRMQQVVKETLKLLRGSLPSTIELRSRINNQCGPILGDPTRIHQIIMNLCTNAYHAMRETGGVLEVLLDETALTAEQANTHADLRPGNYARLSILDTGCGIEPAVLKRIFDPYFTTKKVGEGSGLGLSVVHGIVKEMNGAILVESAKGTGSRFDVFLPICAIPLKPIVSPDLDIPEELRGTERILLVDDELPIVRMMAMALRQYGYDVDVCENGIEAREIFQAAPDRYDIIVTDQTMPQLTGIQLATHILAQNDHIPIILCTGYSDLVDAAKAKEIGIRDFIVKPFMPHILAQAIRRICGQISERILSS